LTKPVIAQMLDLRLEIQAEDPGWATFFEPGISDYTIQRRAEMLLSVDDSLARLVAKLRETGKLGNTMIIFTSDNGYWFGEHGLAVERRLPYEEGLKTPLIVSYPGVTQPKSESDALLVSVDHAATILDAAGLGKSDKVQGRSYLKILSGEQDGIRENAYMEYTAYERTFPWAINMDYRVVVWDQYKYIRWLKFDDGEELYDLQADPYELHNLVDDPSKVEVLDRMRQALRENVLEVMGIASEEKPVHSSLPDRDSAISSSTE